MERTASLVHAQPMGFPPPSLRVLLPRRNVYVSSWQLIHVSWMTGCTSPKKNGVPSTTVSLIGNRSVVDGTAGMTSSRMLTQLKPQIRWRGQHKLLVKQAFSAMKPRKKKALPPLRLLVSYVIC